MKKYKVFFHRGDELTIKTRARKGHAWLDEDALRIEGSEEFAIPLTDIYHAEIFRLHGLGRVIQIEHRGGRLFLSVVRFMIGQFAMIDFLTTGALQRQLGLIAQTNRSKAMPG